MWQYMEQGEQSRCQAILLQALTTEKEASVKHKISDSVSELAKTLLFSKNNWPELLHQLNTMLNGENSEDNICALRIISSCPDLFDKEQAAIIFQLLLRKLNPAYPATLLSAAIESVIAIFAYSPKKQVKGTMGEALLHIWCVLEKVDHEEHEKECQDILSSLIGLVDYSPKLFKPILTPVLQRCIQVIRHDDGCEDDLKHSYVEMVLTLAEKLPDVLGKHEHIAPFVQALLTLLADLEDDPEWYEQLENVKPAFYL
jgi:importin-5